MAPPGKSERNRPRLLALVGVYPPAGGAGAVRLCKLFKHLARLGWHIDVMAPAHGGGFFSDPSLVQELPGVCVHRVGARHRGLSVWLRGFRDRSKDPNLPAPAGSRRLLALGKGLRDALAVPDEHLAWSMGAALYAWRLHRQAAREGRPYAAMFTSSFPYSVHIGGLLMKRATGLPWWVELRDPWRGHVFRASDKGLRSRVHRVLQRQVMAHADHISVISPAVRDLVVRQEGTAVASRVSVIPNGFDPDDFPAKKHPRQKSPNRPLELLYVGSFDAQLDPPGPLLKGLTLFAQQYPHLHGRLRVRVLGGADLECSQQLRRFRAASPHHADLLVVDGFVPHQKALAAMQSVGGLVLILTEVARVYTTKVFEYMASGRPILALVGSEDCRKLLQKCGGAVHVAPSDAQSLARVLAAAAEAGRLKPDVRRRPAKVREYGLDVLAAQLDRGLRRLGT